MQAFAAALRTMSGFLRLRLLPNPAPPRLPVKLKVVNRNGVPEELEGPVTVLAVASHTDSLYGAMNSFYRLEIELPRPVDKMRSWKLELANSPAGAKQHPELAYPRELLPCTAP
jgi:hypothetical protein